MEHALAPGYFRIEKDPDSDMASIYIAAGKTIDYDEYLQFKIKVQAYVIGGQFGNEWITINVRHDDALLEAIGDDFSFSDMTQNASGAY